jgi:hypothetical protein
MDCENLHVDPPLYREVLDEGNLPLKIYTGTTRYIKQKLHMSIHTYKKAISQKNKEMLLSPLKPSTLTAKGKFSNIQFNEEDIIDMLTMPKNPCILKIGCNYGEIFNVESEHQPTPTKVKKSNRGRKPKVKAKSKRKLQGTGKYFSSQITFEVYHPEYKKIYKIKLFRNGYFQVPGVSHTEMDDLIFPTKVLRDYLREEFYDETIETVFFISVMRNYKCSFSNPKLFVYLNKLEKVLIKEKKGVEFNELLSDTIARAFPIESCPWISDVRDYIGSTNPMNIAEIQNNCERYFGLIIKFYRPIPWKKDKKTTIKILRSGKVNFDGGNSQEEIFELYHWLQWFILDRYEEIVYDEEASDSDSDDTEGYESKYDSETESDSDPKIFPK